jgi:hypothetical protein
MEPLRRIVILGALPILMVAVAGGRGVFGDDRPSVGRRLDALNSRLRQAF